MKSSKYLFVSSLFNKGKGLNSIKQKIDNHRNKCKAEAVQIPFDKLKLWSFDSNGNLVHDSGKFFSIEGISASNNIDLNYSVIINQPEVGILGIIAVQNEDQIYFLMQAKYEPGNIDKVQLSPTVQATQSNYTAVHKGKSVPYIEYFFNDKNTLFDISLSEQTGRFYKKKNRNIVKLIDSDIKDIPLVSDDFSWVSLRELLELLKLDNYVNMNTRSIISGLDYNYFIENPITISDAKKVYLNLNNQNDSSKGLLLFISAQNLINTKHSYEDVLSWINQEKKGSQLKIKKIALKEIPNLKKNEWEIISSDKGDFSVIAINVYADREVNAWSQPIIKDNFERIHGLIAKEINGVMHFLVKMYSDIGECDGKEIGPTIIGYPLNNFKNNTNKFFKYFNNTNEQDVILSVMHSDEGGRFFKVQNKHMIIKIDDDLEIDDKEYKWVTLYQIKKLIKSGLVSIELRSIISCINFLE